MGQTKLGYHYKKLIFGVSIILVIFLIIIILLIDNNTKRIVISNEESKQLMNTNALTMMYETEAGSGEYQVTSDTTWHRMDMFLMKFCQNVKMEVKCIGIVKLIE